MPTCVCCSNQLQKSGNESNNQFAKRKYCSRECVNADKKAKRAAIEDRAERALKLRAAVMGGTAKISNAFLNADKVRKIRELRDPLGFTAREIAEMYGCKVDVIHKVLRRVTWSHVI